MTDVVLHWPSTIQYLASSLRQTEPFQVGEWQSVDVSSSTAHMTHELMDISMKFNVPRSIDDWQAFLNPNLPWADEHFAERIGGQPLNPPPSHERWPWARHNVKHQADTKFSHTYPERMWPKHAGEVDCHHGYVVSGPSDIMPVDRYGQADDGRQVCNGRSGIRFEYGDLSDVVNLLVNKPLTRQAYLPLWFPEDTGAVPGQRVPCTLGYHFMIREGRLSCRYYMRSCDIIRHLTDDVYLAGRLMQWMCREINFRDWFQEYIPGNLIMHIASLHAFTGDKYTLDRLATGR